MKSLVNPQHKHIKLPRSLLTLSFYTRFFFFAFSVLLNSSVSLLSTALTDLSKQRTLIMSSHQSFDLIKWAQNKKKKRKRQAHSQCNVIAERKLQKAHLTGNWPPWKEKCNILTEPNWNRSWKRVSRRCIKKDFRPIKCITKWQIWRIQIDFEGISTSPSITVMDGCALPPRLRTEKENKAISQHICVSSRDNTHLC